MSDFNIWLIESVFLVVRGQLAGVLASKCEMFSQNKTLVYYITVEPAMSSHPCNTRKVAFQDRWLLIGGSFVYKMSFWGMTKWPPIGGWLRIRVIIYLIILIYQLSLISLFQHNYFHCRLFWNHLLRCWVSSFKTVHLSCSNSWIYAHSAVVLSQRFIFFLLN